MINTKISRRHFLKGVAITGAAMALPMGFGKGTAYAFYQSPGLQKWRTTLRGVGPGQIPVVDTITGIEGPAPVTGQVHATINISQFTDTLHPSLNKTTLWGFHPANPLGGAASSPFKHLSGIIVAQRGVPLQFTFNNTLPAANIIPVDKTIPGANAAQNRVAVHLHGGLIPWISDGGPFDWWTPNGTHGLSFRNNEVLNPLALNGRAEYYYPNDQSARLLWYHDHAFGITRINAYAGIASAYIIRDSFESGKVTNGILPEFIESSVLNTHPIRELPIVFQDKVFVGSNIGTADPTWKNVVPSVAWNPGSLWYPHVYEKNRWRLIGAGRNLPNPSVIAEMFGDTMLVNGTVYPTVDVDPTQYRLRILNACNARFLNLQLYVADTVDGVAVNGATGQVLNPITNKGPEWVVIGTEGGFLPAPVVIPSNGQFSLNLNTGVYTGSLITGNAERWDVIVDFSAYAGQTLILYNDAPAPFPGGDPRNDYFYGNTTNPVGPTQPGFGPDTRQIMRIVVRPVNTAGDSITIPMAANFQPQPGTDIDLFLVSNNADGTYNRINGTTVTRTRRLTLNEVFDAYGRLAQQIGTDAPGPSGRLGRAYLDPVTENPANGDTEIWEILNLTGDTHPIHFHLVNVQILNREGFDAINYVSGPPSLIPGTLRPPDANEIGWKETVRMNPGEVIRVIMKFDLTPTAITKTAAMGGGTVSVPLSQRTGGHEYLYHCHILEHEEHDMMRPLVVA